MGCSINIIATYDVIISDYVSSWRSRRRDGAACPTTFLIKKKEPSIGK